MGIVELSTDDYWAAETMVPQVAKVLSSKKFKLLRTMINFNEQATGSCDGFYKIRSLINFITIISGRVTQS